MLAGNQNPVISTSASTALKDRLLAGFSVADTVSIGTIPLGVPDVDYQTLNVLSATNVIVDLANQVSGRIAVVENEYITEPEAIAIATKQAIIMG